MTVALREKNGKIMVLTEEPLDKTPEGKEKKFLANIIHEIRTPLDGIIGLILLLLGTKTSPVQREYLNIIRKSTEKLLSLTNDFLVFSKIETQKLHIDINDFCLQDEIYEVLHTLTVRAAEKGLELICDISPDVPSWVMGDPKRINQIIMNLVGNGIKFTEEGEVVLKIDENSGWIYFRASPDNPTRKYLYRVKIGKEQSLERLTPPNLSGTHTYKIAPNAKWAFHSWSNINTPAIHEIVKLPSHGSVRIIEDNNKLKQKLSTLKITQAEFFKLEIEPGVHLDGYMIKPYNFDTDKKHPVLFQLNLVLPGR